jgi:hypothetical protein
LQKALGRTIYLERSVPAILSGRLMRRYKQFVEWIDRASLAHFKTPPKARLMYVYRGLDIPSPNEGLVTLIFVPADTDA